MFEINFRFTVYMYVFNVLKTIFIRINAWNNGKSKLCRDDSQSSKSTDAAGLRGLVTE